MLKIVKENHLLIYDSKQQAITAITFEIKMPESSKKNQEDSKTELKEQYPVSLYILEDFKHTWTSDYFDLQVVKNESIEFGSIPFSLETYLQIYQDPKIWNIMLRPKSDQIQLEDVLGKSAGKLIIRTKFTQDPFILPVQFRKHNLQAEKTIKVITNASNPNEQVVSSAEFCSVEEVDEADAYEPCQGEDCSAGFKIYTFETSERICAQNICIIKGEFHEVTLAHRGKNIKIYSRGKPVTFIPNLEKTMKMLKFIDNDVLIFQNIDTQIEDSYRLVFFTDIPSFYARVFRSYLYSKIFDKWVIEGMVHYNRDNRHFQDCMQELVDLMGDGEQLFPLSNSDYSFDQVWKVKAKFIYHILVNVSGSNLNDWILQFAKKRKLTSPMIFKKIKDKFGKEKIKTIYEQQFINSTGMARIFYDMQYIKRDHKIKLTLRQKSLQCPLFRKYNYYRIKLEESYRLISPIMERILKKNDGKKNQMNGPLAVPKFLKCLPYFVGPLSIQIENMEPFEENLQEQNITEKHFDFKASLRSRRPTTKKNEQQLTDNDSWMMLDAGLVFPAVYKGQNLSENLILNLIKRSYESEIEQLKVLNSISIRQHSKSLSICRELLQKLQIKPGKENSKISVKRKILQLLPNFMTNCKDTTLWDEVLKLMQLYEPVCYDYSQEGNLFLHSLLQSVGNITYSISFSSYFEQFHRIMLSICRFHHSITEDKFQAIHRQIFKSIMKWPSKYSIKILQEACDYLELAFKDPKWYLALVKIIVENVLPYIDTLGLKKEQFKVVRDIHDKIDEHVSLDSTGTIRAVYFHYRIKIAQKQKPCLKFLIEVFTELETVQEMNPESYDKCLDKFKDVLSKNRDRYGLQIQQTELNSNQNYFLAQYLWKQMSSPESLNSERIRLAWMKIYRVFYFYFTPIITMVKLSTNISTKEFKLGQDETMEVLDNIMDFVPDIKWFSVYDSSSNKKKKTEGQADLGRRKRRDNQDYKLEFQDKNFFTDFIANNPGKDSWEDLSKQTLFYLKREYENKESGYFQNENQKKEIDSNTEEKYKKIVEKLKKLIQLLKRGNTPDDFDYLKLKRKVMTILRDAGETSELANELFQLQDQTLENIKQMKQKRENEKNGDLKISVGELVNFGQQNND